MAAMFSAMVFFHVSLNRDGWRVQDDIFSAKDDLKREISQLKYEIRENRKVLESVAALAAAECRIRGRVIVRLENEKYPMPRMELEIILSASDGSPVERPTTMTDQSGAFFAAIPPGEYSWIRLSKYQRPPKKEVEWLPWSGKDLQIPTTELRNVTVKPGDMVQFPEAVLTATPEK